MADNDNSSGAAPTAGNAQGQTVVRAVAQYIKDLSFENPNIERLLGGTSENPNLKVEINVNARPLRAPLYESAIEFSAQAASKEGIIYEVEIVYAGLFHIENMPPASLEPFLLINAPSLIFPFLRRLVADVTREGGFPPLTLDPIDFAGLYVQRKQQAEAGATGGAPGSTTA
jgi:preprotein translocase subunit SecB